MKPEESSLFADLLEEGEEWLMRRILHYAILHDYTRFTSTAEDAREGIDRRRIVWAEELFFPSGYRFAPP